MKRGPWTAKEEDYLRCNWGKKRNAEIAADLCRTLGATEFRAHSLGIRKSPPRHPPELLERVLELHAQGLTDAAIAKDLGRPWSQIANIRRKRLNLPVNTEAVHEAHRKGYRLMLKTLGLESLPQLVRLARTSYSVECGWPAGLRPREVQILNVLANQGPKTAEELSTAIGMRTDGICSSNGCRRFLKSNDGSYSGTLIKHGLIAYFRQNVGGRRLPGVYMLTPEAIAIREACLKEEGVCA